jgi:uncharacterized protein YyaL (SSP411 family)
MPQSQLSEFREPPVLRHLKRLTTQVGIIQHADHEVPDPSHGYSIDDNARALIACLWHLKTFRDRSILKLAEIYFSYLERVEKEGGSFHNFLSFSENVLDAEGSEDSIGRAIWALGEVIKASPEETMTANARAMLKRTKLERHLDHEYFHTKAYILLGLLAAGELETATIWADRLVEFYEQHKQTNWLWFGNKLTYANGILSYALAKAARELKNKNYGQIAQSSFDWLNDVSREQNVPCPIGQNGWYERGQTKALYDQQPLEAADMVLAAGELFYLTNQKKYLDIALEWQGWYAGNNLGKHSMIDRQTGGIYDGLVPSGINQNQGAESIVTFLMAYLTLSQVNA